MLLLNTLADLRDLVVIVYGFVGIIFFAIATLAAVFLFFSVKGLIRAARQMMDDSVKPALDSFRGTAQGIKGTTDFIGETAVQPIIRVYGVIAGVRRGLAIISGLNRRKRG